MPNLFQQIERIDPNTELPFVPENASFQEAFAPFQMAATPVIAAPAPMAISHEAMQDMTGVARNPGSLPAVAAPRMAAPRMAASGQQEAPRRQKISLLDTIGRISDVLATVGGAQPLYQPTLDAREDRQRQIEMEQLQRRQMQQQIAANESDLANRNIQMIGAIARGLRSVQNRGGDIGAAWSVLSERMNMPSDQAAALGNIFMSSPEVLDAIVEMTSGGTEYGMQPFYAQGPDGRLQAYQLGRDGSVRPIDLGEGETPVDPLRFVNVGDAQVGVGSRSGEVRRVLPKKVSPDVSANNQTRVRIAQDNNRARIQIAQGNNQTRRDVERTKAQNSGKTEGRNEIAEIMNSFGINLNSSEDMVENMILNSTNGAAQNAVSSALSILGITTEGRKNIAALKTIDNAVVLALAGGKLGAGVSNADREFFQQMSGKISDPNLTIEERITAWRQIKKRLRYLTQQNNANQRGMSVDRTKLESEARRRGLL